MHTHASGGRRRGKSRSRILYWFRTPPGVRIGRSALDEDAIRLIEQHNPDVEFDWTRILKGQDGSADIKSAASRDRRTPPRPRDGRVRRSDTSLATEAGPAESSGFDEPQPSNDSPTPVEHAAPIGVSAASGPDLIGERIEPAEVEVIEEFLAEPRLEMPESRPHAGDAISAVESRLGSEGLSRLRARYSEVMARISETVSDPVRQEELKTQAERLNPDTWVTEVEVNAGLESYESVFESLRSVVGRRRRRRRRSFDNRRDATAEPTTSPDSNQGEGDGPELADEAGEDD